MANYRACKWPTTLPILKSSPPANPPLCRGKGSTILPARDPLSCASLQSCVSQLALVPRQVLSYLAQVTHDLAHSVIFSHHSIQFGSRQVTIWNSGSRMGNRKHLQTLPECQNGFRKGRSIRQSVFSRWDHVCVTQRDPVEKLIIDFRKVFDSLHARTPMAKLRQKGTKGNMIYIIESKYARSQSAVRHDGRLASFFL